MILKSRLRVNQSHWKRNHQIDHIHDLLVVKLFDVEYYRDLDMEFREDADKTRMTGLPYGEKNYDTMLSRFHLIPERHEQTERQTDRRTDLLYEHRASVC